MKKTFILGIVILLLVGLLITACQNNGRENDKMPNTNNTVTGLPDLDASIEAQIKKDWKASDYGYGSPLLAVHYYGTYNGYVVFRALCETIKDVYGAFKIAGTIFRGTDLRFYLWKDNTFYELLDSYMQGHLTSADISKIGEIYVESRKKSWVGSESSFNEWYFNSDDIDIGQIFE